MKAARALSLLALLVFILTSCNAASSTCPPDSFQLTLANQKDDISPFIQFLNIRRGEMGIDSQELDSILKSYGIYDKLVAKVGKEDYNYSICRDVRIEGFSIGDGKAAVLLLDKAPLYVYVMFSNDKGKWTADGVAYLKEKERPEYRIEKSDDGTRYWLVVRHEANHGTGLYIYDEIWYNPDGSIAAEYPVEGGVLFFPQSIDPEAYAYFSGSVYYDGDSMISISYKVSFVYGDRDSYQDSGFYFYRFHSKFSPVIRDYWEYDLKTRQFKFASSLPDLPESFSTIVHAESEENGILQGYIDFYRARLGDKKVTTLEEWEKFMGLK